MTAAHDRGEVFRALHEIAVAVGGIFDQRQVAQLVCEHARRLVSADGATLRLWDEDASLLRLVYADEGEGVQSTASVAAGEGIAGQAFLQGGAVIVNKYSTWQHANPAAIQAGRKSVAALPLRVADRLVGTLAVSFAREDAFGPEEAETLLLLAAQIAPALEAARLLALAEQRQREAEMHGRKELFLDAIVENIPHMIFVKDAQTLRFVRFNRAGEELIGVTREMMIGKSDYDFFPREQADWFTQRDREVLRNGILVDIPEEWIDTSARGRRLLHTKKIPIPDETGAPEYLLGISEDITEQKQAAAALQAQADLLNLAHDAILVRDLRGDSIQYWSNGAEEIYGWSGEEAAGQATHALLQTTFPRPIEELQVELERTGRWEGELQQVRRDGSQIVVLSRWALRRGTDPGSSDSVLELNSDVTARKALDRMKDELVSTVSHELRTPLAALVGFAELLLTREWTDAQRREFLATMHREGLRLTDLINTFLDLRRLQAGNQGVVPRPTELLPILRGAAAVMAHDTTHPLVLDVPEELPRVVADPARVEQVLANLLSNATKYSPEGGEVRLSARVMEGEMIVAVADQGLGIALEELPRLFERFYRVERGDQREIGGTGLGLAISKTIVEAQGGRIWVESDGEGQGSTITFTLPLASTFPALDVLVVEDDTGFGKLLVAELALRGYSAGQVDNAETALDHLKTTAPRALILDLLLPGMSGEAFLQQLRSADAQMQLPVVVLSVLDVDPRLQRDLERLGAGAVYQKGPRSATAVAEWISQALGPK